jgi:PD-(D/E)XK nuclease superfamily
VKTLTRGECFEHRRHFRAHRRAVHRLKAIPLENTLIRASSLPTLFDCAARWYATQIEKKRTPSSAAATLGSAVHASTAAFDSAALLGNPVTADEAAGAAVDRIHHPTEDVDWEDETPQRAENVALALHSKYCRTIAPTQDYVGVEATCEALTIEDLGITLVGTIDRVYRAPDGDLGVADLKTGKTAVNAQGEVKTQGHGLQLATYELLAEVAIGQPVNAPARIIGMQTGQTDKGQRIGIGEIDSPRDALIGSSEDPGALQFAAQIIKSGMFPPNPRSQLCGAKFCPAWPTCRARQ